MADDVRDQNADQSADNDGRGELSRREFVAISIGLYFRRLRAIPLTGIPALIGTAVAYLAVALGGQIVTIAATYLASKLAWTATNSVCHRGTASTRRATAGCASPR